MMPLCIFGVLSIIRHCSACLATATSPEALLSLLAPQNPFQTPTTNYFQPPAFPQPQTQAFAQPTWAHPQLTPAFQVQPQPFPLGPQMPNPFQPPPSPQAPDPAEEVPLTQPDTSALDTSEAVSAPDAAEGPPSSASSSSASSNVPSSQPQPETAVLSADASAASAQQGQTQNAQQRQPQNPRKKSKDDRREDRVKGRKKENSDDYYYYDPEDLLPNGQGEGDPDYVLYDNRGSETHQQAQTQTGNEQQGQQVNHQQNTGGERVSETDRSQPAEQRPSQMREDTRDICTNPQNTEVTFFVPYDSRILLSYGKLQPKNASSASNSPLQDSIGSYYCANNSNLCIQDVFGRQWRPADADNLITIMPAAKCIGAGRQCAVFLLMMASRPSPTADLVSSTGRLRYSDMVANSTFIPFDRHVYLPIQGFSCDSCSESYCRPQLIQP